MQVSAKYFLLSKVAYAAVKPKHYAVWGIRRFKWEWAVQWDTGGTFNRQMVRKCQTRWEARAFKSMVPTICKPRIVRRLIQVDWEPYADTFTYNAKGNGNGR